MQTHSTQDGEQVWDALSQEVRTFGDYLKRGGTPGELRGISDQENEAVYALGRQFYGQRQYEQAFKIFSVLVMQNSMEPRYLMGLGAAGQMIGRYRDALTQYMTAAVFLVDDPQPIFHSAQCLAAMGHTSEALETLELAISLCSVEKHGEVAEQARQLMARLQTYPK
ncbi:SycD/LcrH family type III secretion system chaperone [Achromobacter marplatensis]|uniref:SycD/LcrH family type III secretion system chaperone n=1 Tax=Achromobacter marplatensis TaxID=470868 RepID=UPI0039F6DEB3